MQKTINYTGRRKVEIKELQIQLQHKESEVPSFNVDFNLNRNNLPDDAAIYIEAYCGNTLQRFYFGKVGAIQCPENRTLDQLDLSRTLLFRIHIVDESVSHGRIIASADKLRPEGDNTDDQRSSLLTLRSRPLNQQTWKIEFDTGGKPELCINSRIPYAIEQVKSNPQFQSLILPNALRQVLMFYLWNDDNEEGIGYKWINFAEHIADKRPDDNDPVTLMNWIDDVIESFSNSFVLCDMLIHKLEEYTS